MRDLRSRIDALEDQAGGGRLDYLGVTRAWRDGGRAGLARYIDGLGREGRRRLDNWCEHLRGGLARERQERAQGWRFADQPGGVAPADPAEAVRCDDFDEDDDGPPPG